MSTRKSTQTKKAKVARPATRPKKPPANGEPTPGSVRSIPTADLRPNEYNPNVMSEEKFAELVAEVRHLQRLPKPVVVRPDGNGYVIVDGEHGWRAAKEAGLAEVLCEVIQADPFESMRQTYKRNQHGEHDPVLLGRMFRRLLKDRNLSSRQLAKEICVSEGTIRNATLYADAADLRNSYALSELSVRQVRSYLALPQAIGDLWLDSGANLKDLQKATERRRSESYLKYVLNKEAFIASGESANEVYSLEDGHRLEEIVSLGFVVTVQADDFVTSMRRAWDYLEYWDKYGVFLEEADALLLAAAELHLPVTVFDGFPALPGDHKIRVPFTASRWGEMLRDCQERSKGNEETFKSMLQASIRLAVKGTEFDQDEFQDPRILLALQEMPDYIREADIPTEMKLDLWRAEADVPDEVMEEMKKDAIDHFTALQNVLAGNPETAAKIRDAWEKNPGVFNQTPLDFLNSKLAHRQFTQNTNQMLEVLDDRDKLLAGLRKALEKTYTFRTCKLGDRLVSDVLWERLMKLPWPELFFLACHVLGYKSPADNGWINLVAEELGRVW
jgi:ParB family chromosome partitioning protein